MIERKTAIAGGELETARLILRPPDSSDLSPFTALFADPAVNRHLALGRLDTARARRFAMDFITRSRDERRETGFGPLALATRAGNVTIGYCGLRPLPDRVTAVELIYALAPKYWGQGLASEAARACVEEAFRHDGLREVLALTRPGHAASRRVMERIGMRFREDSDRYYGEAMALYAISARDPQQEPV